MSEYRYEIVTDNEELANYLDSLIVGNLTLITRYDKEWDGKRATRERK